MHASDGTAFDQLMRADIDWLRDLPATATFGSAIFACHTTPQDDQTYWLEALTPGSIPHMAPLSQFARAKGPDDWARAVSAG